MKRITLTPRVTFTLLVIGMVILYNCSPKKKLAPDRNFYFEIIRHGESESSHELAAYLKEQIPTKKYTITNLSGLIWPFYKEIDLDESISQDSLMPPHWYLHKMTPFETINQIKRDEFLVRIDLLPQPDTLPNYSVKILKMDSTGLTLSAESGIHYIDSTEFTSKDSLFDFYLRSIIRYSFK
jgi:hypothetical protein